MANRSYLYVVDEIPGPGRTPTIKALSEWRWDIPDAFRVLLSPAPQAVPSTIWSAPIQAVLGDYDAGLAAFERFLAALPPSPEVEEQAATALAAKAALAQTPPVIYPTSATAWPSRASSIPARYTGAVHFNARKLGAVSVVVPSDMVDGDELTRWFDS